MDQHLPEDNMTTLAKAVTHLEQGYKLLLQANDDLVAHGGNPDRRVSIAITQTETAMMFANKARTTQGELEAYATHTS